MNDIYVLSVLGIILLIATITDLAKHKVYNWLTFPALGLGLGLNVALQGVPGLWFGVAGLLIGGLLFFPAFLWGGMGAGDIKLVAVVGAFAGWIFVLNVALYTALVGGVIAVVVLIVKGELWQTLKNISRFLRSIFVPKLTIEPLSKKYPMPYALAIALGTLAAYLLPPIVML
ncbi:prepilin peptidase [bacterium]|nr:prepilin peptidase [bacterium]